MFFFFFRNLPVLYPLSTLFCLHSQLQLSPGLDTLAYYHLHDSISKFSRGADRSNSKDSVYLLL